MKSKCKSWNEKIRVKQMDEIENCNINIMSARGVCEDVIIQCNLTSCTVVVTIMKGGGVGSGPRTEKRGEGGEREERATSPEEKRKREKEKEKRRQTKKGANEKYPFFKNGYESCREKCEKRQTLLIFLSIYFTHPSLSHTFFPLEFSSLLSSFLLLR
jgi:hypothetical protein